MTFLFRLVPILARSALVLGLLGLGLQPAAMATGSGHGTHGAPAKAMHDCPDHAGPTDSAPARTESCLSICCLALTPAAIGPVADATRIVARIAPTRSAALASHPPGLDPPPPRPA